MKPNPKFALLKRPAQELPDRLQWMVYQYRGLRALSLLTNSGMRLLTASLVNIVSTCFQEVRDR